MASVGRRRRHRGVGDRGPDPVASGSRPGRLEPGQPRTSGCAPLHLPPGGVRPGLRRPGRGRHHHQPAPVQRPAAEGQRRQRHPLARAPPGAGSGRGRAATRPRPPRCSPMSGFRPTVVGHVASMTVPAGAVVSSSPAHGTLLPGQPVAWSCRAESRRWPSRPCKGPAAASFAAAQAALVGGRSHGHRGHRLQRHRPGRRGDRDQPGCRRHRGRRIDRHRGGLQRSPLGLGPRRQRPIGGAASQTLSDDGFQVSGVTGNPIATVTGTSPGVRGRGPVRFGRADHHRLSGRRAGSDRDRRSRRLESGRARPARAPGQAVIACSRRASSSAAGSARRRSIPALCRAIILVMSPSTLILPPRKACMAAWASPSTRMALAVS